MKIYLLPGLGADRRMYTPQLKIFPQAEVLEHLKPNKNETLQVYSTRVAELIDKSSPFILIGTSLGGMVALELSKLIRPEKLILIATVKNRNEMPAFIRSMKYLHLHKLIKGNHYKMFNTLLVKRLDNRRDSTAASLIKQMTIDTSPEFIEWAVDAVIKWQGVDTSDLNYVHIHGTKDQLFPISKIQNSIPITGGSHIMNLTMSQQVNQVLIQHLQPYL
jgi:esterase/lipase